jgi:anti-anti-sigma factor
MPETNTRSLRKDHPDLVVSADKEKITIWLAGEQDCTNARALMDACAAALRCDQNLVIDVSRVEFMSVATVDVIASISELLAVRKHSLRVREPSRSTRRLLDLCELADLVEVVPEKPETGAALNSWVHVPVQERVPLPETAGEEP